jgi:hypothetical protein
MGAAESSNSAKAVTNVSNFVSNSTSANVAQVSAIKNSVDLNNCQITLSGDFDVNTASKVQQSSTQIVTAAQNANLQNNVAQQVQQTASSSVGCLGIGYASANNSVNTTVNSSNSIINSMSSSATENSAISNNFECDRSTIIANNLNIGFSSSVDFLSTQNLSNPQTAKVINKITQSITQTATATVEGMGSLILAYLMLAAVVIYSLGKPLESGAATVAVNIGLGVGILGIGAFQFINQTPPFFAPPMNCINNSSIGMGTTSNMPECINKVETTLSLGAPPLKYTYPIMPGGLPTGLGNLLQMSIAKNSGQTVSSAGTNGGYTVSTLNILNKRINSYSQYSKDLNIPNIPNPLYNVTAPRGGFEIGSGAYYAIPLEYQAGVSSASNPKLAICTPQIIQVGDNNSPSVLTKCPESANPGLFSGTSDPASGIANLNIADWNDYLNMTFVNSYNYTRGKGGYSAKAEDEKEVRSLFARFVLCDLIGHIDLHHYVNPKEYIKYIDSNNNEIIQLAGTSTDPDQIYKYNPNGINTNYSNGFNGSGTITGHVGVINNNQYKFQKFMSNYGIFIIIGICILACCFMAGRTKPKNVIPK